MKKSNRQLFAEEAEAIYWNARTEGISPDDCVYQIVNLIYEKRKQFDINFDIGVGVNKDAKPFEEFRYEIEIYVCGRETQGVEVGSFSVKLKTDSFESIALWIWDELQDAEARQWKDIQEAVKEQEEDYREWRHQLQHLRK